MPTVKLFPMDVTYKVLNSKPVVHIFGKTIDGKQMCVVYEDFKPYFYVIPKPNADIKAQLETFSITHQDQKITISKVDEIEKNYVGKKIKAYKVTVNLPQHVPILREELKKIEGVSSINENDILFFRRFLIDNRITPLLPYEFEGEFVDMHLKVPSFKATNMKKLEEEHKLVPKILSVDIETYAPIEKEINAQKNPILMIAFYGEGLKKVFTWKKFRTKLDYVEFVKDEKELILKFKEVIESYGPDILTGYFSDGFDLPYIKTRADKFKVKLDIGLDKSDMKIKKGIGDNVQIDGITHIDIFKFIRKVMFGQLNTDKYNLNSVSEELLGEKKKEVDLDNLSKVWDEAPDGLDLFCEYNLVDADLTYRLTEKMFPNISEMVKITGLTMFDVNRMGFSQLVEWYLLKQAPEYDQIAPNKPHNKELVQRRATHVKGAFVFEPKPGLYHDIVVFDYLSLYPTIISSHNLSGENVHYGKATEDDAKVVPLEDEKLWFSQKKRGFLPTMIEGIIRRRMEIKEELKNVEGDQKIMLNARQYGLKLLANSFYGYLGFYGARWYSLEAAEATTAFGRYYIKKVISGAEKKDFKVIYSDTDSVFLTLDSKSKQDALAFADEINEELPGLMELEFEGFYPSGIFVSAKAGQFGAKKRYALIGEDDQIKIKGFESVRRNTSIIAKETQEKVFEIILKEHDKEKAFTYVRNVIADLRENRVPLEKTVISIQLQKEIDQYDARGPHVAVAQRMKNKGINVGPGTAIRFIVTQGSDKIREKAKEPEEVKDGEYDSDYYINNQLVPSVERIFNVLGYTKEDLLESKDQTKLDGFF